MSHLFEMLNKIRRLSPALQLLLIKNSRSLQYQPLTEIVAPGSTPDEFIFVQKGIVACFATREGKEHIIGFRLAGQPFIYLPNLHHPVSATIGLRSVIDSTLLCIPYEVVREAIRTYPEFEFNLIEMISHHQHPIWKRQLMLDMPVEKRVYQFFRHFSPVSSQIPNDYICNYLNTSLESISDYIELEDFEEEHSDDDDEAEEEDPVWHHDELDWDEPYLDTSPRFYQPDIHDDC